LESVNQYIKLSDTSSSLQQTGTLQFNLLQLSNHNSVSKPKAACGGQVVGAGFYPSLTKMKQFSRDSSDKKLSMMIDFNKIKDEHEQEKA
jgi:hypothetical protein